MGITFFVGATTENLGPGVLYQVKASYKYQAEDVDELNFEVGEVVDVVEYDDPEEQVCGNTILWILCRGNYVHQIIFYMYSFLFLLFIGGWMANGNQENNGTKRNVPRKFYKAYLSN